MSATVTATTTYSVTDIENVMRNFGADLHMIAQSSNTRTRADVDDVLHDITFMAKGNYIEYVDITLLSQGRELRAARYKVNETASDLTTSRPGGVMWPKVEGATLRIVVGETAKWTRSPIDRSRLIKPWSRTNDDLSHRGLQSTTGRNFVSNGYGLERKDYQ